MELLGGDRRKPVTDGFVDHINPFHGADGGCDWAYGDRQPVSVIRPPPEGNDGGLVTPANLAPPQKLRPIRYGDRPPSEDRHPLDILAGTLEKLPELGFLGDGCFEAPSESGGLARGFVAEDPGRVRSGSAVGFQGPSSGTGASLSSSLDNSDDDSSVGVQVPATGKRKRKSREKLEHFLEKLVGDMMKRQEKMHKQLIEVIERKERERIQREEAWKQQEMERMKRDEEARTREISRNLALISFIQTVIGHEIEIPQPPKFSPAEQSGDRNSNEVQTQKDVNVKFGDSNSRRWPEAEMQALIMIRSEVEDKLGIYRYSLTGGKGSIWDEISARMREMGYDRSAKKCKEKWENMNKYYRKVMEGGKKQPEHSKTRSYFQELHIFYKNGLANPGNAICSSDKNEGKAETS